MPVCVSCNTLKPVTDYHVRQESGILRRSCKSCIRFAARQKRAHLIAIGNTPRKIQKRCNCCKFTLSSSDFGIARCNPDGLKSVCKKCECVRSARYSALNTDAKREQNRRYRIANKNRIKRTHNKWRQNNRSKIRATSRESSKRYRQRYPWKEIANRNNRRARLLGAWPKWARGPEIWDVYCECSAMNMDSPRAYHVDHIVPLKNKHVCGLHVPWNLRIIKGTDNMSKGNRWTLKDGLPKSLEILCS